MPVYAINDKYKVVCEGENEDAAIRMAKSLINKIFENYSNAGSIRDSEFKDRIKPRSIKLNIYRCWKGSKIVLTRDGKVLGITDGRKYEVTSEKTILVNLN